MKASIWKDERWPDYYVEVREDGYSEVPDELYARFLAASKEYDAVQGELSTIYAKEGQ